MTFQELEERLLGLLNQMVRRGEISERRLARLSGYTQPHIHNVLKGVRKVNARLADAMLQSLEISMEDLLEARTQAEAPLWRGQLGPSNRFPESSDPSGFRLLPSAYLERFGKPILLRLATDEDSMAPWIEPGDLVLVDRAEAVRQRPVFECIYVLALAGHGAVCRCQVVGNAL